MSTALYREGFLQKWRPEELNVIGGGQSCCFLSKTLEIATDLIDLVCDVNARRDSGWFALHGVSSSQGPLARRANRRPARSGNGDPIDHLRNAGRSPGGSLGRLSFA